MPQDAAKQDKYTTTQAKEPRTSKDSSNNGKSTDAPSSVAPQGKSPQATKESSSNNLQSKVPPTHTIVVDEAGSKNDQQSALSARKKSVPPTHKESVPPP